jgi:two-component system capsular synthesis sensor histidine kinase RcsC
MKELKYIAENRLTAENGILALRGRNDKTEVPDFEPLFPDSDCSTMATPGAGRWNHWPGLCATGATIFPPPMT